MTAVSGVFYVARAEIRRRWLSVVYLAVLVGIVGASVFATAAGARRTSTALTRFNTESQSASVQVTFVGATKGELARFRSKPNVAAAQLYRLYAVTLPIAPNVYLVAPVNSAPVDRARVVRGRLPNHREHVERPQRPVPLVRVRAIPPHPHRFTLVQEPGRFSNERETGRSESSARSSSMAAASLS